MVLDDDLRQKLEEQLELLEEADILLIPVGGKYTINAKEASEVTHDRLDGEGMAAERLRGGELGQEGPGVLAGRCGHGAEYPASGEAP